MLMATVGGEYGANGQLNRADLLITHESLMCGREVRDRREF
jgi:hypothetical protein